jgi:valyl-tRNA synthetase
MVMAGKHFMGKTPFHHVYFTGLVRDKQGRKMSKSLGNFPDTFKIIEKYGTDALRFSLINQLVTGGDIKWDEASCDIGKTFANKLWNASRYLVMASEAVGVDPSRVSVDELQWNQSDPALAWILTEYKQTLRRSFKAIDEYEFAEYSKASYEFVWMRLCDWFVELIKPRIQGEAASTPEARATVTVALQVLEGSLRLLHPLMPYVTEEIWQRMGRGTRDGRTIGLERLVEPPAASTSDEAALAEMDVVRSVITGVRRIRGDFSIHPGETLQVIVDAPEIRLARFVTVLEALSKVKVNFASQKPSRAISLAAGELKYFVILPDTVDVDGKRAEMAKRLERIHANIRNVEGKLGSESFTQGAPAHVVEGARAQLAQNLLDKGLLEETLAALG